jgi:DNA-binding CsgD family transcriptional regulator
MTTCEIPASHANTSSDDMLLERPLHRMVVTYRSALLNQERTSPETGAGVDVMLRQQGEIPLPKVFHELLSVRESAAIRVARLTSRQHQVMEKVLAGEVNKTIAWELGISQRTVENHRAAIMRKTGSKSLPALARLALAAACHDAGACFVQSFDGITPAAAGNDTGSPARGDEMPEVASCANAPEV